MSFISSLLIVIFFLQFLADSGPIPAASVSGAAPVDVAITCTEGADASGWGADQPPDFMSTYYSGINEPKEFVKTWDRPPYSQGDKVPTAVLIKLPYLVDPTNPESNLIKMFFYPLMDQFSMMQIVNSSDIGWLDSTDSARIRVEQMGAVSQSKRRMETGCTHRVPFWTLVVTMDQGVPIKHEWDDDCSLCTVCFTPGSCADTKSICVDNNCAEQPIACTNRGGITDCDLKIYIGWTGTDSNGVYLTSAGKRLSQFRMWSLNAAYNAASQFSSQNLPVPPTSIDQCPTGAPDANGNCVG